MFLIQAQPEPSSSIYKQMVRELENETNFFLKFSELYKLVTSFTRTSGERPRRCVTWVEIWRFGDCWWLLEDQSPAEVGDGQEMWIENTDRHENWNWKRRLQKLNAQVPGKLDSSQSENIFQFEWPKELQPSVEKNPSRLGLKKCLMVCTCSVRLQLHVLLSSPPCHYNSQLFPE